MPPNLDDNILIRTPPSEFILYMTPLLPNGPLSDDDSEEDAIVESEECEVTADPTQILIPLEQNLRALLVQVTGTEDLESVTQVKLRVIARDVPLQHISLYIPALRELILDGSVVSTLRELGCNLRNLKVLKVNRCNMEHLDNMLGLENLEELYAADNFIENCMPLAFLSNLKAVDLRRNRLKNVTRTLPFLTICEKLEHVYLEGNDEMRRLPRYRQTVKGLLPALKSLDGIIYSREECNVKISPDTDQEPLEHLARNSEQTSPNTLYEIINGTLRSRPVVSEVPTGFTVTFPPKVFLERPRSLK